MHTCICYRPTMSLTKKLRCWAADGIQQELKCIRMCREMMKIELLHLPHVLIQLIESNELNNSNFLISTLTPPYHCY